MTLKRACTLMTVKSVNEDERIITGIASTPSPDRDGDIMEPEGAKFRSDTPFLWQHDRSQPIGTCTPKMVKEGLQITAKLVNPRSQSWDLTFVGLESYIKSIKDFLDRHEGTKAFAWKPPLEDLGLYRCKQYKPSPMGGGNWSLTATFIQAFKP